MIVLDTHALVFDALSPERLGAAASKAIERGASQGLLACCDISLWELAMLVARGRLDPGMEATSFLETVVRARNLKVIPITPDVAVMAQSPRFTHGDPADRLIAATAICHQATLVTADRHLHGVEHLKVVW